MSIDNKSNKNSKNNLDKIDQDEKVCYNCKYFLWLVGIGQGIRCEKNRVNGLPSMVPNRRYTCELFEKKE